MQIKSCCACCKKPLLRSCIGGTETIHVDVRVIGATNNSLEKLVKEGKFREDLFYRLNVLKIDLPPLRERQDDIAPLGRCTSHQQKYSLGRTAAKPDRKPGGQWTPVLLKYSWPGNIRQLENVIQRALRDGTRRDGSAGEPAAGPDSDRQEWGASVDRSDTLAARAIRRVDRVFRGEILSAGAEEDVRGHVGPLCQNQRPIPAQHHLEKIAQYKIDKAQFKQE